MIKNTQGDKNDPFRASRESVISGLLLFMNFFFFQDDLVLINDFRQNPDTSEIFSLNVTLSHSFLM